MTVTNNVLKLVRWMQGARDIVAFYEISKSIIDFTQSNIRKIRPQAKRI